MSQTPLESPPPAPKLARNPPSISFGVNMHEFKWWRRITWGAIVTTIGALGAVGSCGLNRFDVTTDAMAQTKAKADTAVDRTKVLELRLEAVDSGTRVEVANLRKEMAEDRAETRKQLGEMQNTMQAVLREVKKR